MPGVHHPSAGDHVGHSEPLTAGPFPALRATGLVKRFGPAVGIDGVDLVVAPGEVRGLLGPNSAGKTTLLRMLLGLITPDEGTVELLGWRGGAAAGGLPDGVAGFVEEPAFYPYLSGRANLEVLAELDGDATPARPRIDAALARVGLAERSADRVGGYSTGMRQRLGVAAALLRAPELLLLDEPTSGLDPAASRQLRGVVRELADAGAAVLLSSHQIGELEDLCDAFTVLRCGRVAWDGPIGELRRHAPASSFRLATTDDGTALDLAASSTVEVVPGEGGELRITGAQSEVDGYILALGHAGVVVRRLDLLMSPLESTFRTLTEAPLPPEAARVPEAPTDGGSQ